MDAYSFLTSFSQYVGDDRRLDIEQSMRAMRVSLNKSNAADLFRACAENLGDWPSDSSYEHNNGFTKISLLKTDQIHARLHIWHEPEVSPVHNHGWDLVSYGACGEIEFGNFREADQGIKVHKTLLAEERGEDGVLLSKKNVDAGQVCLALTALYNLSTGTYHALDYATPHRSRMLSQRAVSLMVTGPSVKNESAIYELQKKEGRVNQYTSMSNGEKSQAIRRALQSFDF